MTQEDLARDGLSGDQGVGGATLVLSAPPPPPSSSGSALVPPDKELILLVLKRSLLSLWQRLMGGLGSSPCTLPGGGSLKPEIRRLEIRRARKAVQRERGDLGLDQRVWAGGSCFRRGRSWGLG